MRITNSAPAPNSAFTGAPLRCVSMSLLKSVGSGARRAAALGLVTGVVSLGPVAARAQTVGHGVAAALLQVVQKDTNNTAASVTVAPVISINDFRVRDGSNRGDYNVQVGEGFSDDVESGVLIACVAENGRDNGEAAYPGTNFCTAAVDYNRSGGLAGAFWVATFQTPTGDEFNINVAAAFFPYRDWLGGFARNSGATNGGANDLFTGSPGLVAGTHFVDLGNGRSLVDLRSLGIDARTDGVLLVCGGKNEDNYALAWVNPTNGTWTVFVKDNGTDAGSYEQDPVAFVFIPKTNTSVISGRFRGDGTILLHSGASPQFSITPLGTGRWRLSIPGYSPASGVLVVSPEGGGSQNQDNIVTYQPDGNDWVLESRDLPGSPPSLQTPGGGAEPVASFVFIPSGAAPGLLSPDDRAWGLPTRPTLQVAISNAVAGEATVRFFGRVGTVNPAPDFSIVLLPDTQFYVSSLYGGRPEMFIAQAEWIITNRLARNIAYVAHLGDITQNGDLIGTNTLNLTEWRNATNAMYRLENPVRTMLTHGIPYGLAVGNHDQEPIGDPSGTTLFYNQYFGVLHFLGRSYYGGHYGTNNNNHFDLFSAGGLDFIVLYFEYDPEPDAEVLAWANEVLRTNAQRRAIVVTHNMGNTETPVVFSAQGATLYHALKTNANLFLMLGGHVTGEGRRVDTFNGRRVHTLVQDYQGWTNGGNGYLRILEFSPSNNLVIAQTYSPWADEYQTGPNSEFWFEYDMTPFGSNDAPFELLGVVSNVPPGGVASLTWPGRNHHTAYDWFVTVTDARGTVTTGPVWRFITAPNAAPVATNQLRTIPGDAPTFLTLTAADPNNDPLTFQIRTLPTQGLLSGFNPAEGTLSYLPARNYRGYDRFTWCATDGAFTSAVVTLNLQIVAPPDTNGNALPDAWETIYGVSDPDADDDGDGMSNLAEYRANTNPTNAASALRLRSVSRAPNGHVTLSWDAVGGTRYRVQFRDSDATGAFTDVLRPLAAELDAAPWGAPSTQQFVDDFTLTGGDAAPARFYRVRVVP
jgi:hypothetical protein